MLRKLILWRACAISASETPMAIPVSYNIRNLKLRKGLTIMTALMYLLIALVVL